MAGRPDDQSWNTEARHETPTQRLDRNWGDLLQELRVTQTGVQFLTGFLLTLPFQQRFSTLDATERVVYLCTVAASVTATGFLVAPVSLHRLLFRQHARAEMVDTAHRLALSGLTLLAVATTGVAQVVFAALLGTGVGWLAAGVTAVLLVGLWGALPLLLRRRLTGAGRRR